jgi:secreted PhoX family phosphatase
MFRGYDANNPTGDQADIQLQAHGGSIVLIQRDKHGGPFRYRQLSRYNRRITATTPMRLDGPAAGDALLQTSEDASGRRVSGMLNNCAGGVTPWGTVLTAEENFHQYFANLNAVTDPKVQAWHQRYLLPPAPPSASGSATTTASTWPRSRTSPSASAGWSRSTPTTPTSPRASTPASAG